MDGVPVVWLPISRGPENISVLSRYAKHVVVPLLFNTDNVSSFLFFIHFI